MAVQQPARMAAAAARATTRRLIDELADETGWAPDVTLAVAGALQYREYDLPTRVLMRLIARQHGASTDAHDDAVYTDWAAVERFAAGFAEQVRILIARAGATR